MKENYQLRFIAFIKWLLYGLTSWEGRQSEFGGHACPNPYPNPCPSPSRCPRFWPSWFLTDSDTSNYHISPQRCCRETRYVSDRLEILDSQQITLHRINVAKVIRSFYIKIHVLRIEYIKYSFIRVIQNNGKYDNVVIYSGAGWNAVMPGF